MIAIQILFCGKIIIKMLKYFLYIFENVDKVLCVINGVSR